MAALAVGAAMIAVTGCGMFMESAPPRHAENTTQASIRGGCDVAEHRPFPASIVIDTVSTEPVAVTKVSPEYPNEARQANVDGTVVMRVLVCEHGRVIEAKVKKSIAMLDATALTTVRQWRFTPATRDGRNVSHWIDVPMKFTLN